MTLKRNTERIEIREKHESGINKQQLLITTSVKVWLSDYVV
jgi:hypothetical protein